MQKVTILGSGSWGVALGIHLSKKGIPVDIWSNDSVQIKELSTKRESQNYLPGVKLPQNINFTGDLEGAISNADIVVIAVPSHVVREVAKRAGAYINKNQIIVNVAKGIEEGTSLTMSQVISQELPNNEIVVLYGPSHAEEVAREIPTTIVSACRNIEIAKKIQDIFMSPNFRVYTNTDVIGVEIGGSIKNIIALCAGISDGLGFGDNTKAALMTRGLAEIGRIGVAMGANPMTFAGLSGVGDLIVTCTSMHSRNRRCGILIGQGKTLEEAQKEVFMVVEGVITTKAAHELAKKYNVSMPITEQAYQVLFNNKNPRDAVYDLMMRDKKDEI